MSVGMEAVELVHMATFVAVVKHGSFTEAAFRLGVDTSVVSRRVSELERRLGVPLLARSSRRARPTDVGGVYYAKCVRILQSAEQANEFAASFNNQMSGRLRIIVPGALGLALFADPLNKFSVAYPDVLLEITSVASELEDALADDDGFDMAVQIGRVRESNLIVKPLASVRYVLCASPAYLARHGRPATPESLQDHFGLIESPYGLSERWRLKVGDDEREVAVRERMRGNDIRLLVAAAQDGLGIVLAPEAVVMHPIASGRLEVLLPGYAPEAKQVVALYPTSRRSSQKVQALLAHLTERLVQPPILRNRLRPGMHDAVDTGKSAEDGMPVCALEVGV